MTPTVDSFRALTRSSPWRFSTLHFTYAAGTGAPTESPSYVECWLRRPGDLLVVENGRRHHIQEDGAARSSTVLSVAAAAGVADVPDLDAILADRRAWTPPMRPDGLVAARPDHLRYEFDAPMWENYAFVAALDPLELSHHVAIDRLRTDVIAGRPVWRADLRPQPGYDPRCGGNCCELLWSVVSWHCEDEGPGSDNYREIPADTRFPEHYDVAIDVQTGIVLRSLPVGGRDAPWLRIDIIEVDGDVDAAFDAPARPM